MRLIYHEQTDPLSYRQQNLLHEFLIGEALRRHQQRIYFVPPDGTLDARPIVSVGRVDGARADT